MNQLFLQYFQQALDNLIECNFLNEKTNSYLKLYKLLSYYLRSISIYLKSQTTFNHLFACIWGSMINGHLLLVKVIIALSTDNESSGKPAAFQSLI